MPKGKTGLTDEEAVAIWHQLPEPRTIDTWKRAARIGTDRACRLAKAFRLRDKDQPKQPVLSLPARESGDTGGEELTGHFNEDPTIEDILERHKVDLEKWFVKEWRTWTAPMDGMIVHLYHVRLQPLVTPAMEAVVAWFRNQVTAASPQRRRHVHRPPTGDHMLEISCPDAHIGKRSWGEETGVDHGTIDGCRQLVEAHRALYEIVPRASIAEVLLPIGNDLFNSDTVNNETTAGTHQDDDGPWNETFRAGTRTVIDIIEDIAAEVPVKVLMVPGNHDWTKVLYLGEILAAWFRTHDNVTVDNRPTARKYHQYGANLLGFTHGKHEKLADLPILMATECRDIWSNVRFPEWHLGHEHTQGQKEKCGVIVKRLPSLTPPDSWHTTNGFIGNRRAAKAFLYHRDRGQVAEYTYQVG